MASVISKKREAGKLNKICLTLDDEIKILDVVKIGKTQATNVVKNEARLRVEYENFQGKGLKHLK